MANTVTRPHVFRRLMASGAIPIAPRVLSKATLTELSHTLENAVIAHELDGAVFTGFQRSANWLRALERYERLVEPRARSVAVFAQGNVASMGPDAITKVELAEDSPLVEEWFLIVLTPAFSAVLIGEEIPETGTSADPQPVAGTSTQVELDRRFSSIWSFDPAVVATTTRFVRDEVAEFDPAVAARIDAALDRFPPARGSDSLREEVLRDIVDALERSRRRQQELAELRREAAEELRALDRAKTAFLSAVSHELRTPLTVVQGMAETLDRIGPELPDSQTPPLRRALREHADRLASLLDDLLDVDRMTRGALRVHVGTVELTMLTHQVVGEHPSSARVEVHAPGRLELVADSVQLERILTNLLDNAQKYAPEGPIDIRLTGDDDRVVIEVRDHGPGIATEEQRRVFEPFHRGDDDHPQPGTGVGLALVAEFARLHGGDARAVTPPDGSGVAITVTLPRDPGPLTPDG